MTNKKPKDFDDFFDSKEEQDEFFEICDIFGDNKENALKLAKEEAAKEEKNKQWRSPQNPEWVSWCKTFGVDPEYVASLSVRDQDEYLDMVEEDIWQKAAETKKKEQNSDC